MIPPRSKYYMYAAVEETIPGFQFINADNVDTFKESLTAPIDKPKPKN